MWIKTSNGNLVDLDKFARIYCVAEYFCESDEKPVAVLGVPAVLPPTEKTSGILKTDKKNLSETENYEHWTKYEWLYDDFSKECTTFIDAFKTVEEAKEYINKLAQKLGAEEIR